MTGARKAVDWDAVEPHYRAGIRALKDIGAEFGCSDAAIIKRAKTLGWTRNLKAKVQARADAKVSEALVSAEVSERKALTEAARVEVEAEVQARIRLGHRSDIDVARKLVMKLFGRVEALADQTEELERLGEIMRGDDADDQMARAYRAAISLPSQIKGAKDLVEALRVVVDMERKAFGIEDSDSLASRVKEIAVTFVGAQHDE